MNIVITQWALDAYLDAKHSGLFGEEYYKRTLKPDALLLREYPNHPKFDNGKFWSPASYNQHIIPNGFKMKWHQVGNGKVQLRLPVTLTQNAFLCAGYAKRDDKLEKRQLAKFKTHCQLIEEGRFIHCGELK